MNREIRTILLAEDSSADAEMALDALREAKLVNPVVHVEDGVEALDYLFCRNSFSGRARGNPAVVLLDIKMPLGFPLGLLVFLILLGVFNYLRLSKPSYWLSQKFDAEIDRWAAFRPPLRGELEPTVWKAPNRK